MFCLFSLNSALCCLNALVQEKPSVGNQIFLKVYESMMNNLYVVSLEASAKESVHVFCLVQRVSRMYYEVFGPRYQVDACR